MERRASGRLAGKAATVAAVAASTKRAAATVKGGVRKGSSSSKRQRSASPSSAPTANSNDAAAAATGEMLWGSSWWDKLPAEIRIMILDFVGPLRRFLNGEFGTKEQLERNKEARATAKSIWVDALKRDWQGNLGLLPDIELTVRDGLCEVQTRSMYERLRHRFPHRLKLLAGRVDNLSLLSTCYYKGELHFSDHSLLHIPARRGWFDLLDIKQPITFGWFAIIHGHVALLRHLAFTLKVFKLSQFREFRHEDAMDIAASSGSLEIVQMLHDAGNNHCTAGAMDSAAEGGHLDVMHWLHANRREGCTERASKDAAGNGHLRVLEWLVEHYPSTVVEDSAIAAAREGHVDVLAFLLPRFPDFDAQAAVIAAAENGHVDVLAFLLHWFPGCGVQAAMRLAAYEGHLEVIKCFHAHRPDAFTPRVFTVAVERNHADIVQFLLDCGYAFDVETISEVKDPAIRKSMVDSLTLDRARALLEDAKTKEKGFKMIVKLLEAAVSRLEKAEADADNEAIAK